MFIKIVKTDGEGHFADSHVVMYDCVKYTMRPATIEEDESLKNIVMDIDAGEKVVRTRMIDITANAIYIMNNDGKTIDRFGN